MYSIEMALLYAQARQRDFVRQAEVHQLRKRLLPAKRTWRHFQFRLPAFFQGDADDKRQEPVCTTC